MFQTSQKVISYFLKKIKSKRYSYMRYKIYRTQPVSSETINLENSGYKLVVNSYATGKGTWNYTRGLVYDKDENLIADVKRNYSSFWHYYLKHINGNEYLLCGENYQGITIVNLTKGTQKSHLNNGGDKGFGFCFSSCEGYDKTSNRLIMSGCIWGGPYEDIEYDVTHIESYPWPETNSTYELIGSGERARNKVGWAVRKEGRVYIFDTVSPPYYDAQWRRWTNTNDDGLLESFDITNDDEGNDPFRLLFNIQRDLKEGVPVQVELNQYNDWLDAIVIPIHLEFLAYPEKYSHLKEQYQPRAEWYKKEIIDIDNPELVLRSARKSYELLKEKGEPGTNLFTIAVELAIQSPKAKEAFKKLIDEGNVSIDLDFLKAEYSKL